MTIKYVNVQFDGLYSGILVGIKNDNSPKEKFIMMDSSRRIFNNLRVAKMVAPMIIKGGEFTYYIKHAMSDDLININRCMYCEKTHTFQFIDQNDGIIYNFKEKRTCKLSNFGYLIFENGDTVRTEKEYGFNRQKELMSIIVDEACRLLGEKWEGYGITRIERKRKEIVLHIKSTTTKIHIVTNSKLMDINQAKTLANETDPRVKRIPFIKTMDKFVTFYVFATRDLCEGRRLEGEEKAMEIINVLLSRLQKYYPEITPKMEIIDFLGYIDLED